MAGRDYYSIMLDAQFTRKLVHISVCAADSQEAGSGSGDGDVEAASGSIGRGEGGSGSGDGSSGEAASGPIGGGDSSSGSGDGSSSEAASGSRDLSSGLPLSASELSSGAPLVGVPDNQESGSCSPAYSVQVTSLGSDVSISGLEHSSSTGLLYGYAWSGLEQAFYSIDPLTASVQVAEALIEPQPHVRR